MLTAVTVVAGIVVATSIGLTVIAEIDFRQQTAQALIVPEALWLPLTLGLAAIAAAFFVVGFAGMRRRPGHCSWLVVSGAASQGIIFIG